MGLLTLLRISPAVWLSPFLTLLAIAYANTLPVATRDPYPLALTAAGAWTVALIAPVCAACAAWEGGRLRRAGWFALPHVRPTAVVALMWLLPVLVVGFAALAAAIVVKLVGAGGVMAPDPRVLAVACAVVAAQALLGFAIGVRVPPVVAVPAVLLGGYTWIVLPIALEPLWLRHLTGAYLACCDVSTDLAPRAIAGSVVVAGGLAGTAGLLMRRDFDAPRLVLAIAPTVLAFGVGAFLVHGLGHDPVVDRRAALACSSSLPRVCVWPEHRGHLEEVSEIAGQTTEAWRRVGGTVPSEFSEQRPASLPPGARSFGISVAAARGDIVVSLVQSLLPPPPPCAFARTDPYYGARAAPYVGAWLATAVGLPPAELERRFRPAVLGTVAAVRALPLDQQRAWLERNLAALNACGVQPQLEPGT